MRQAAIAMILAAIASANNLAAGQEREIVVDDVPSLQRALERVTPGTTISIAAGRYRGGLTLTGLAGEPERPIRIAAQDPQQPPVFEGGGSGLHLVSPRHVELRDLVFTGARGNGLNIDDGGRANVPAQHVVLTNLQVRDVGPRGNRDGIKLSGVYDFVLDGCVVEQWGDGGSAVDMVGCHRGRIAGCTFQNARGDGANAVQTKGGSRDVTITRCRFENAGGRSINVGGSTGLPYFRPKLEGFEAKDIIVEDCIFVGSAAPIAFVGVDGAIVRHNTIYRPTRWIVRILQESQGPQFVPCRNGQFVNNLIVYRSDEVRTIVNIGGGTEPGSFRFAENAWYCLDRPELSRRVVQALPVMETQGTYGVEPQFRDADAGDFRLQPESRIRNAGVRAE